MPFSSGPSGMLILRNTDLSKTPVLVPICIKLWYRGPLNSLSGTVPSWFRSYLEGRGYVVATSYHKSDWLKMTWGINGMFPCNRLTGVSLSHSAPWSPVCALSNMRNGARQVGNGTNELRGHCGHEKEARRYVELVFSCWWELCKIKGCKTDI